MVRGLSDYGRCVFGSGQAFAGLPASPTKRLPWGLYRPRDSVSVFSHRGRERIDTGSTRLLLAGPQCGEDGHVEGVRGFGLL